MLLTDAKIRNTKPGDRDIRLKDGKGLFLIVRPSGAKVWIYRYWLTPEKEGLYTIGDYPQIQLAEARAERDRVKELVRKGINPAIQRKVDKEKQLASNESTFQAVAEEWIDANKAHWSDFYEEQVRQRMRDYVFHRIGGLPVREIEAPHILSVVSAIERAGKPTVAHKVLILCNSIFKFAVSRLKADRNPCAVLENAVRPPPTKHANTLTRTEIPELMKKLISYNGRPETVVAIRLMLLTFVRTGELIEAAWTEFDFTGLEWYIPASRMKMKEPHIVPLSRQALVCLEELKVITGSERYIFPNMRDRARPMSAGTINQALARMGYEGQFSGHGFRGTASTLLHEMEWPPHVIERQLAHAPRNKVAASYNHAQYLSQRKEMMQAWANWLDSIAPPGWNDPMLPGNVTPLAVASLPGTPSKRISQFRSNLMSGQS